MNELKCTIKSQRLNAMLSSDQKIFASLKQVTVNDHIEHYNGPYEVTPQARDQTLSTKSKYMDEDINILKIPYAEVTNGANGTTITIGGE